MLNKTSLAILANESYEDIELWIKACEEFKNIVDYEIIDLTRSDWYDKVQQSKMQYLVARPPGLTSLYKQLYDERLMILSRSSSKPIYPSLDEVLIYENKRYLSYWLQSKDVPHPKTYVFYNKKEAESFIEKAPLPLVAKMNIGSSGRGIEILRTTNNVKDYLNRLFDGNGVKSKWGPNLQKKKYVSRFISYIKKPSNLKRKLGVYKSVRKEVQQGYVILQEYIEHEFEWRVVCIGKSYFAHKKLKYEEKASGSLLKQYDDPPIALLDFAREIMEKHELKSQALDIFQVGDKFLVNEMQCYFGQADPYQMLVDGKCGRYVFVKGGWHFEQGDFNSNQCYNLRLEHVIELAKVRCS